MKIVFIAARTYYGESDSYEYLMEAGSLTDLGHDVTFVSIELPGLIERVESTVKNVKPDCIIYHPTATEIDLTRFAELKAPKITILADDDWRRDYGLNLAHYSDYVLANAADSMQAYGAKALPFQWGVRKNWYAVKSPDVDRNINLSFIGMNYGYRGELVKMIEQAGIPVQCFGHGWSKKLPSADMPDVFWHSWISLNTSMSSQKNKLQIKARNFEVPAARALLLGEYAPGLEACYEPDKEAVFWKTPDECIEKLLNLLTDKPRLNAIAQAGYERTLAEHTYDHRWKAIFEGANLV